ncbi:MAG: hypothetical protein QOH54_3615, partial [Mycobacterium sp.]|nr:hypothetical protein [Mycobacterium sp.]
GIEHRAVDLSPLGQRLAGQRQHVVGDAIEWLSDALWISVGKCNSGDILQRHNLAPKDQIRDHVGMAETFQRPTVIPRVVEPLSIQSRTRNIGGPGVASRCVQQVAQCSRLPVEAVIAGPLLIAPGQGHTTAGTFAVGLFDTLCVGGNVESAVDHISFRRRRIQRAIQKLQQVQSRKVVGELRRSGTNLRIFKRPLPQSNSIRACLPLPFLRGSRHAPSLARTPQPIRSATLRLLNITDGPRPANIRKIGHPDAQTLSHDLRRQPLTATLRTHPPAPPPRGRSHQHSVQTMDNKPRQGTTCLGFVTQILAEGSDNYVQPPITNTLTSSSQPVG